MLIYYVRVTDPKVDLILAAVNHQLFFRRRGNLSSAQVISH